jgi:hypothetical protein
MSDELLNRRYLTALKAIAREHRISTGKRRITGEQRGVAKYHAKLAAQSPVYQAILEKRKVPMPSDEQLDRARHTRALKDLVRSYKQGWNRRKVAPEHRASLREHAYSLSHGRGRDTTFLPRKTEEHLATAQALRKRVNLVRVGQEWFTVDHVHNEAGGRPSRSKDIVPVFFGLSVGYGMNRYVVLVEKPFYGHSDSVLDEALEVAMGKWPRRFFDEVISVKAHAKLEEKDPDEAERYMFIESLGKMGIPESEIWIKKADEYTGGAIKIDRHGRIYRLPDGRVVEAK